jgi:hypothetical protein
MDATEYYKPPRADLDTGAPQPGAADGPLASIRQITVASFLGGPLAATLLIAGNLRRLGRRVPARNTLIAGVASSVVLMIVALLLPARFPKSVLPVVYTLTARSLATTYMGGDLAKHFAAGGPKMSGWRVAGVAVAAIAALLALALPLTLLLPG